ncbi:MAG: hypothetical protein OEU36_09495 [Gammaproteobacteria bacterium]|nr:hypothetical protein [Gammaproteobacteria bacterium]
MWESHIEVLEGGRTQLVSIKSGDKSLPYSEVVSLWQNDKKFRDFFIALLTCAPFAAYLWETPPVTKSTMGRPFEFVVVDSPELASAPSDHLAFASYFESADSDEGIVSFPNLGGDAFLVVPCPRADFSAYPHIAAFSREAPKAQQHALWKRVGKTLEQHLYDQPVWLSTSGLGIYWLHIRLDSRPKYYSFAPYKKAV